MLLHATTILFVCRSLQAEYTNCSDLSELDPCVSAFLIKLSSSALLLLSLFVFCLDGCGSTQTCPEMYCQLSSVSNSNETLQYYKLTVLSVELSTDSSVYIFSNIKLNTPLTPIGLFRSLIHTYMHTWFSYFNKYFQTGHTKHKMLISISIPAALKTRCELRDRDDFMPHLRRVHSLLHLPPQSRGLTRCTDSLPGTAKILSSDVKSRVETSLNLYKPWWRDPAATLTQTSPDTRVNKQYPLK